MANATKNGKLQQIAGDGVFTLYPETSAAQVKMSGGSDAEAEIGALKAAVGGAAKFYVADDIDARDALEAGTGDRCYVHDATDDASVAAGGAEYLWTGAVWVKISEAESMDFVATWANLQNKPSSSAANIDAAVSASHTHSNKAVLDKLTEGSNGLPLYNGSQIGGLKIVSSIPGNAADGLYFVTVGGA